ncbi:cob(I)yrinic acid a,c-diamide adenosyltransferase [Clostridium carnis]
MELGLIHIYCGNGKGKTTAAMGLGMRAAGRGKKVLLTQFLKDHDSGELKSIEKLSENFHVFFGMPMKRFFNYLSEEDKNEVIKEHRERFKAVTKKAVEENYDLLIMDETMASLNYGILELDEVINFLENKPKGLEVVLTGRNPDKRLVEIAHYVSEINPIKHPYVDSKIPSRIGIEK